MADFHLVGNGTHLYRRSSHLVRTPIVVNLTLTPDQRAFYAVAGSYTNAWPTAGFIESGNAIGITHAGKKMRRAFLTPGNNQIWRAVTTAHDPEFVFYQGAYSTTHGIRDATYEAYMQLCGYHFTIPAKYAGFGVESARLNITHGGTVLQYGQGGNVDYPPYFATTSPDWLYATGWKVNWHQRFGLFSSLDRPTAMFQHATDDVELNTTNAVGYPDGWRDLWGITGSDSTRGSIPTARTPYVQSVGMSVLFNNSLNTSRGGWVVGIPDVGVSSNDDVDSTTSDYPYYYPGGEQQSFGYWLGCSYWGLSLSLTLTI